MVVELLNTNMNLGLKAGHYYLAEPYWVDPEAKVVLLVRLSKKDRKPIGKNPRCTQYRYEVKIIEDGVSNHSII